MEAGVPDVRRTPPSGPAAHVLQTIRELKRLGHQVRLVAKLEGRIWATDDLMDYRPVTSARLDGGAFRMAERLVRRAQRELRIPYLAWFDGLRFAEACRRELAGFDLLYERMGWMGQGGSLAAHRMGIPHVLEVNGDHVKEHEMLGLASSRLQAVLSTRTMRRVAQRAAHAVTSGEGWRRRHVLRWGIDAARTSVIHNGSEVVDLLARGDLRCYRRQPPEPGEPLRLIYVGSFDPWQSLPMLLRAVSRARRSGTGVTLTLAGSGRQQENLEKLAAELELGDRLTFAGHVPMSELGRLLARADVGLSLYDGREEFNGLKILDYKSAGLATIATGRDGEPSVLRQGVTGVIIPPGDEDALVNAIRRLALGRMDVVRMGCLARHEAERGHGWRHTALALDRLFHSLVVTRQAETCAAA